MVRTGLTFSASAIALAPSSPMELYLKSRLFRTGLTFSASAIASAPSSPMEFFGPEVEGGQDRAEIFSERERSGTRELEDEKKWLAFLTRHRGLVLDFR